MNDALIIKQYMGLFLEDKGFHLFKDTKALLGFENITNPAIKIYFNIRRCGGSISTELKRGKNDDKLPGYPLIIFWEGEQFPDPTTRSEYWYYDNETDLIGALEEQASILEDRGFDWLFGRSDIDLDKMLIEQAAEREKRYNAMTQEERDLWFREGWVKVQQWMNRRVKPVKWTDKSGVESIQ